MKVLTFLVCTILLVGCATPTKKEKTNIKSETERPLQQIDNKGTARQSSNSLCEFKIEKTVIDKSKNETEAISVLEDKLFYNNGNSFCRYSIKTGKTDKISIQDFNNAGFAIRNLTKFFPVLFTKQLYDENDYDVKEKKYDFVIVCIDISKMTIAWEVKARGSCPKIIIRDNMAVISYNNITRFVDCTTGTFHDVKGKSIVGYDVWLKLDNGFIMSVLYFNTNKESDYYQRFIERRDENFNIVWSIENGAPGAGSLPISETYEFEKYPGRFYAKRCFEELREVTCYGMDGREIWTIGTSFSLEVFDVENGIFISQLRKNDIDDNDCNESVGAYSLEDGKLIWESESVRNRQSYPFGTTTNLTKGCIYVCSTYAIYKINKINGTIIWMLGNNNKQLKGLSVFKIVEETNPTEELTFSCMDHDAYEKANFPPVDDKYKKFFTVDTTTGKKVNPANPKSETDIRIGNPVWADKTVLYSKNGESVTEEDLLNNMAKNNAHIAQFFNSGSFKIFDVATGEQMAEICQSVDKPSSLKVIGLMRNTTNDLYFNSENYYYYFDDYHPLELLVETEVSGGFQVELWKISNQLRP